MRNPLESLCAVSIQGLELSDKVLRDILYLTITFREKKAADGSLALSDPTFRYFDSKLFLKNAKISFILGLTDDSVPMGPFLIKALTVEAGEDGSPTLVIKFQDMTHALNKKKDKKAFTGSCVDFAIAAAKKAQVGHDVETPKGVIFDEDRKLIQAHKTEAAMMNSLAERYGFVWGIEGKTLYFRRPKDLDEVGRQNFTPVLSYRINDFSLQSYRAEFNFTKEGIRQAAKKKTENIDFENCDQEVGNYITDVYAGSLTPPEAIKNELDRLKSLSQQPNEETDLKKAGDSSKNGLQVLKDLQSGDVTNATESIGTLLFDSASGLLSGDTSEQGINDLVKTPMTPLELKVLRSLGLEENSETGSGDSSGTATPASEDEAKKRESAHLYRAVTVCDVTMKPTIPSPRYKPTMGVILAGLGERLSGKYRLTEVTHVYSCDNAYSTELRAEKRLYGSSDDDKKKIAAAAKAVEQGDTSKSTPGGSDKVNDENDAISYADTSNKLYEGTVKMVDGVPEE
jgi:phage protein D